VLRHSTVLHVLHNPRYAGAFTYGRHREQLLPGGKRASITVPRQEWTSFIPGAHPGYVTLGQWEANTARLAANAAAHGLDRAAGPPREGPALLQGIIICGRRGGRMTIRYHARGGKDLPTYLCQRDGTANARPICAAIPSHTLDENAGQLLISTLTPLAAEAALQVSAELRQRAAEADALRAAHVERARYHADLARRRYLAVDPSTASSPAPSKPTGTPPCAPSTTPRPPTTPPAPSTTGSSPTSRRTGSPSSSPTCPASGTTPPPRPQRLVAHHQDLGVLPPPLPPGQAHHRHGTATMRKISFKPTSRKSSHGRPRANRPPAATRRH
jgi:Recombinase